MRVALGVVIGGIVTALIVFAMTQLADSYFARTIAEAPRFADAVVPGSMAEVPRAARVVIVLIWFVGALLGALVADLLAGRGMAGWIVAGGLVVYLLIQGVYVPRPAWMALCGVVMPSLGGYVARKMARVPL